MSFMNLNHWRLVGGGLFVLAMAGMAQPAFSQNPVRSNKGAVTVLPPRATQDQAAPLDKQTVEEILSVREQFGGGVGTILGQLDLGQDENLRETLQKEFETELMRLSQQARNRGADDPRNPRSTTPQLQIRNSSGLGSWMGDAGGHQHQTGRQHQAKQDEARRRVFRDVARQLEGLSWELEEVDAYAEADRLRQLSAEMRERVRVKSAPRLPTGVDPRRSPNRTR